MYQPTQKEPIGSDPTTAVDPLHVGIEDSGAWPVFSVPERVDSVAHFVAVRGLGSQEDTIVSRPENQNGESRGDTWWES